MIEWVLHLEGKEHPDLEQDLRLSSSIDPPESSN